MQFIFDRYYAIEFFVLLSESATENIFWIWESFKDDSKSQVKKWHKMFEDGRKEMVDEARSGYH